METRNKIDKKAELSDATAIIQEILEDNTDDLTELVFDTVEKELGISDDDFHEVLQKIEEAGADVVYDLLDAGFRASALEVARILIEKVAIRIADRVQKYL